MIIVIPRRPPETINRRLRALHIVCTYRMVFELHVQEKNKAKCVSESYILSFVSGADPGFWERGGLIKIYTSGGGYGRGRAPSRDGKGSWGTLRAPPVGSGASPQPLFCFCVYFA